MAKADRVVIYLADLTHTGFQVATENIPLNIGLVASYAKKCLGDAIEVRLFKYPEKLMKAIKERIPDILGCSNYVWNSNLSRWVLGYAKGIHPDLITVLGGPNYPLTTAGQLEFLSRSSVTDFRVLHEGELAFLNLVMRFMETRSVERMKEKPIAGCQFISPRDGSLISGPPVERLKALDEIPSPYVTGLLDEFFDGRLTPIIETTRGCPFQCNYCNAGNSYFNKVNMFSFPYVEEELSYIAPRVAAAGVAHLIIADNNFGMYPRDAEICGAIRNLQQQYGWPLGLLTSTGKNNPGRIIKAAQILGNSLLVSMSVQSMDKNVLVNIKRNNIRLETYTQISRELVQQGRSGMAEVIFPLPGETYESYMRGIESLIGAGANKITSYTLQLNYGTDYKEPEYRRQHGYDGKWRLVPLDFGEYEGERIFDAEEVAVCSKYASFEDYLLIRGFALLTECLYNNYILWEILRYLKDHGMSPYTWLRAVWDRRNDFPGEIRRVFESFSAETKSELFDSEAELIRFYGDPENYSRLLRGEIGGNVIFKHKARLITRHMSAWVNFVTQIAADLICSRVDRASGAEPISVEVEEIRRFLNHKFAGMLNPSAGIEPIVDRFRYDILAWLRDKTDKQFSDFYRVDGIEYVFCFSEQQVNERRDSFRRYGTSLHGLAKILARVPSHERLFRQVSPIGCYPS